MPISNTALVSVRLCKLQKKDVLDSQSQAYQLLPHGRWLSPGIPASSTSETGLRDIAELLLKATLNTKNQIINSRVCMFLQSKPGSKSELQLLNSHLCEHSFFQL